MQKWILFFLLLMARTACGQEALAYYQQINRALVLVAEGQYASAAQVYQQVFEASDFVYARDCIHAVEVAAMARQDALLGFFIRRAMRQGVPYSYFERKTGLEAFRTGAYWRTLANDTAELQAAYHAGINSSIRQEINAMFAADQAIRKRYYRRWNFLWRPVIGKKWQQLNQQQVLRLIEITRTHGFPGERLIGIDSPADHPKVEADKFSAGMPIILLVHHYSHPNPSFDSLWLAEVLKGNLHNAHFAAICDYQAEFGKNRYPGFGYVGWLHVPEGHRVRQFQEKRKRIGLVPEELVLRLIQVEGFSRFWKRI